MEVDVGALAQALCSSAPSRTVSERVDPALLQIVLNASLEMEDCRHCRRQLRKIAGRMDVQTGFYTTQLAYMAGIGRGHVSVGLQNLPHRVRSYLAAPNACDVDFHNCGPVICAALARYTAPGGLHVSPCPEYV